MISLMSNSIRSDASMNSIHSTSDASVSISTDAHMSYDEFDLQKTVMHMDSSSSMNMMLNSNGNSKGNNHKFSIF